MLLGRLCLCYNIHPHLKSGGAYKKPKEDIKLFSAEHSRIVVEGEKERQEAMRKQHKRLDDDLDDWEMEPEEDEQ